MSAERKRLVLITGGAGGLGRAMAARFVERGDHCLLADLNESALGRAQAELGAERVSTFAVDLSDAASRARLVEHVVHTFGRLDVLVNNAGVIDTTPFEQRSDASVERELAVNLLAPLVLTRALLPLLAQAAGGGRVISIVSLGGLFPMPETPVYCAAKFGLRGAMLSLGLDAQRLGVRVSVVNPSATETPMLMHEAIHGGNSLQFMDPPQRPEHVAEVVMRQLRSPRLERFVRAGESWLVRFAMLVPSLLERALPWFRARGEAGRRRYVASLAARGLIRGDGQRWQLLP
jgi:2-dehydro-3-deoxy-L-rhamnonate dehydrogenase (NAD+)